MSGTAELVLWYAARVAALSAFAILALALLTGMAIRSAYLSALARNRAVLGLHSFLSWFWVPLVAVHIAALLLDGAARIGLRDLVIPFQVSYAPLAVGLGTVGLLLLVLVGVTGALRRRMSARLWTWIHRLSYPMFVVFLLHAQLAGTDFSRVAISVAGWAVLGALAVLAIPRLAGARMAAAPAEDQG